MRIVGLRRSVGGIAQPHRVVTPEDLGIDEGSRHPGFVGGHQDALECRIGNAQGWLAEAEGSRFDESETCVVAGIALEEDRRASLVAGAREGGPDERRADPSALKGWGDADRAEHLDGDEP